MSAAAVGLPPIVASVDDDGTERITVFGTGTSAICGAFEPPGHTHWRLYVGRVTAIGVSTPACTPATACMIACPASPTRPMNTQRGCTARRIGAARARTCATLFPR
jgi:hypothetical protein